MHAWVALLQAMLKVKTLLCVKELRSTVTRVWFYLLHHNTSLSLDVEPPSFHIMVDWSACGVGYALFADHLSQIVLLGILSKGFVEVTSSLFLGKLKGLVWAMNGTKILVQNKLIVLWIDSQSVFK